MPSPPQYELIGGPYDGSFAPGPQPGETPYFCWQLPNSGRWATYRFEASAFWFERLTTEEPPDCVPSPPAGECA